MRLPSRLRHNRPRRGAALLLCLAFTAAAISMILMLSTRSIAHVRQAESASHVAAAFSAAEVAQAHALADLRAGGSGTIGYGGTFSWGPTGRPPLPHFDDPQVQPKTAVGPPETQWFTVVVQPDGLPDDVWVVFAMARVGGVERRLETVWKRGGTPDWQILSWRELPPDVMEGERDGHL